MISNYNNLSLHCPHCNAPVAIMDRWCRYCGASLVYDRRAVERLTGDPTSRVVLHDIIGPTTGTTTDENGNDNDNDNDDISSSWVVLSGTEFEEDDAFEGTYNPSEVEYVIFSPRGKDFYKPLPRISTSTMAEIEAENAIILKWCNVFLVALAIYTVWWLYDFILALGALP